MTELDNHRAQPTETNIFRGNRDKQNPHKVKPKKIALSRKNWNEQSESMNPTNIEQKLKAVL